MQGEEMLIIGNPLGLEYSVSNGIVSAIRNDETMGKVIQFNAPISSGNSGSPLIDLNGYVSGIVSYQYEEGQNLNFAISIQQLNLLEPVNKLQFPENPVVKLNCSRKDFQRTEFGTSLIKVSGIEKSSEKDDLGQYLNQITLDYGNNYSENLSYLTTLKMLILLSQDLMFLYSFRAVS